MLAVVKATLKEQDNLARCLLIEQTKKELLNSIKKYRVGICHDGQILATKSGNWDGILFVIPEDKLKEMEK